MKTGDNSMIEMIAKNMQVPMEVCNLIKESMCNQLTDEKRDLIKKHYRKFKVD